MKKYSFTGLDDAVSMATHWPLLACVPLPVVCWAVSQEPHVGMNRRCETSPAATAKFTGGEEKMLNV